MAIILNEMLRNLPKVDQVLARPELSAVLAQTSREVVVDAVRDAISLMRSAILEGKEIIVSDQVASAITLNLLTKADKKSLRRVINGTGIILHTNLGRARLAQKAAEAASSVAVGYSTLEYDLKNGERGSRHDHVNRLLSQITGAEDAIAVNNNAAATLLVLSALCKGREIPVSRGELVEIGGAFRVPEIMEVGGALLHEVGTTNKTHPYDYINAINDNTGAILKVHTSNYRIMGFTEDVGISELVGIAHEHGLPCIYDIGSGLMVDLNQYGLDEPTVTASVKAGADIIMFSGDKLFGGPQAGIIIGKKKYIDIIKSNPYARAMRLDKMTLAALEETLRIYRDIEEAKTAIPVLRMITMPVKQVKEKAATFAQQLRSFKLKASVSIMSGTGRVGGGSAPMLDLQTWAVAIVPDEMSVDSLADRLRTWTVPIICHIQSGCLLIDMRTVDDDEMGAVAKALTDILS